MLEKENEKLKKYNSESQAESSYYNARCDSLNVSDYLYYIWVLRFADSIRWGIKVPKIPRKITNF